MSVKQDHISATLRAIAVLEIIVRADRPVSLTEVMSDVNLPKPTVYRILNLLAHSGLLLREPDRKRYTVGPRLARIVLAIVSAYARQDHFLRHRPLSAAQRARPNGLRNAGTHA